MDDGNLETGLDKGNDQEADLTALALISRINDIVQRVETPAKTRPELRPRSADAWSRLQNNGREFEDPVLGQPSIRHTMLARGKGSLLLLNTIQLLPLKHPQLQIPWDGCPKQIARLRKQLSLVTKSKH